VSSTLSKRTLLKLIERCLREDSAVDIDGFGSFQLDDRNHVFFEPSQRIRVFLAYADEDRALVKKLYAELQKAGFEPWMDQEKLVPGQNWPRAIERAIDLSDFFLGCFSKRSIAKRGHFQCELRYALDLAARVPLEDIFLVPLRLDDCEVPRQIATKTQYVDLFPDWSSGVAKLTNMMRRQVVLRRGGSKSER
jgi:hypothetical protein